MAIAFVAASSNVGTSTAFAGTIPAGAAVGNQLVCFMSWNPAGPPTVTNPTGWSQYGTDIANSTTEITRILTRTAVSDDPGGSFVGSSTLGVKFIVSILAYSGVAGLGAESDNEESSTNTSHVTTALSGMAAANSWAIAYWTEKSTTNTSWAQSGLTQRINQLNTGGGAVSALIADSNAAVTTFTAKTATSGIATHGTNVALELLAVASVVAPGAPTGLSVVAGDSSGTVSFTPGSTGGAPVTYTATTTPGSFTGTGSGSPIAVGGLANGTSYTVKVTASNSATGAYPSGTQSAASSSFTPAAAAVPWFGSFQPFTPAGVAPTPPAVGPIVGAATTQVDGVAPVLTAQESWDAIGTFAGLKLNRVYNTGFPATYQASAIKQVTGPQVFINSIKPDVTQVVSGAQDVPLTTFANSVPAPGASGPQLIACQHEPEQKAKGILPATYGAYFARTWSVFKAANPNFWYGPIVMCYTVEARPVDSVGHSTLGANEWLGAVAATGITPDYVGLDGYPGNDGVPAHNTIQLGFQASVALVRSYWPTVPIVFAELGLIEGGAGGSIGQKLVNGYAWAGQNNVYAISYFDTINGVQTTTLTNAELLVLGGLAP